MIKSAALVNLQLLSLGEFIQTVEIESKSKPNQTIIVAFSRLV